MSFDIEFDYSDAVNKYTNLQNRLQSVIDENNTQLSLLQSSPYAAMVEPQINKLINSNTIYNEKIENIQSILNEITYIQSLSIEDKEKLYYFYTVLGDSKQMFMAKLLFNSDIGLLDPNVQTIFNDTTTLPEIKLAVAKALYNKYNISSNIRTNLI